MTIAVGLLLFLFVILGFMLTCIPFALVKKVEDKRLINVEAIGYLEAYKVLGDHYLSNYEKMSNETLCYYDEALVYLWKYYVEKYSIVNENVEKRWSQINEEI